MTTKFKSTKQMNPLDMSFADCIGLTMVFIFYVLIAISALGDDLRFYPQWWPLEWAKPLGVSMMGLLLFVLVASNQFYFFLLYFVPCLLGAIGLIDSRGYENSTGGWSPDALQSMGVFLLACWTISVVWAYRKWFGSVKH